MRFLFLLLILFAGFILEPASAQSQDNKPDSLKIAATQVEEGALKPHRSPMGALLRSVVVPGWGQMYNHRYIKAIIVAGVETFFAVKAIDWWSKTEDQYRRVQSTAPELQFFEFNRYINYRQNRDDYLWATGITIFISMFDAYVDAHLAGFDVDVTPEFEPKTDTAQLKLSLKF